MPSLHEGRGMEGFDLDLGAVEGEIDVPDDRRVVLGVLDGETPGESWIEEIARGSVLVLAIEGELAERVEGFAAEIKADGGSLVHFRDFLIVAPPDVDVDTGRL